MRSFRLVGQVFPSTDRDRSLTLHGLSRLAARLSVIVDTLQNPRSVPAPRWRLSLLEGAL